MDKPELRELLKREMSGDIEKRLNNHVFQDHLPDIIMVNRDILYLNYKFNNDYQTALEKGERFSDFVLEEIRLYLEPRGFVYSGQEENYGHTFRKKLCCYKGKGAPEGKR